MEERRASPRHALNPALAGRLICPGLPCPMPAAVLNLSPKGVRIYLPGPAEATDTAFLELLDGPVALRRLLAVRILYVYPAGDGGHFAGGALDDPLTDAELSALRAASEACQRRTG